MIYFLTKYCCRVPTSLENLAESLCYGHLMEDLDIVLDKKIVGWKYMEFQEDSCFCFSYLDFRYLFQITFGKCSAIPAFDIYFILFSVFDIKWVKRLVN